MGVVIYRKSDNEVMAEVVQFPLHDTKIFEKFIANGNYNSNDYAKVEIKEDEIPLAFQKEIIIQNGKITFGNDRNPVVPLPIEPSEADKLRAENEMLQASVMELSAYAASQDERLQMQENAVMELSMLVAGGGA
ncbi:hypothetical protein MKZ20_20100 [Psychrobacillus sp. FSL K6-2684]|uniref:hypothetical protein n=1 Tax=Psychrobacillus sp. FSL K6-2684 TaxID=2921547 RepID=UPI0030FB534F